MDYMVKILGWIKESWPLVLPLMSCVILAVTSGLSCLIYNVM